jgi:hypothetical protein
MDISFDKQGNLFPPKIMEVDWDTLVENFINYFPKSSSRKQLLLNLERFIRRVQADITTDFTVWIDGSFISQKLNPNDIDAVFWIPFEIAERKKSILDNQFFTKTTKNTLGLDFYYAIEYPEYHKRHFLTHLDKLYWEDVYGHTRQNENGFQYSKGFLLLKFNAIWKN